MGGGKIQECREINRNRPWNDDVTKSDIYLHVEPDLPNMGYERDTDAPILILKANGLGLARWLARSGSRYPAPGAHRRP